MEDLCIRGQLSMKKKEKKKEIWRYQFDQ